jgi:hypothetical protein
MIRLRDVASAFVLLAALGITASSDAQPQQTVKHSGTIVDVHDRAGTFLLAEVGPWRVRSGETVVTRRTIALAAETTFAIVKRTPKAPNEFPGDFVELPIDASEVYVTDYVTVECRHEGKRLIATKITVIDMPGP